MADDDIIRGGLDIVTDKTKKKKNRKADQETAQPTAARFNNLRRHDHNAFSLEETTTHMISRKVLDMSTMQDKSGNATNEDLPGVLGNKGTWPFTFREQGIFLNNF